MLEFGEQTPVSAEGQIRQITDALHHDRPSLAVVIATDILDTIFIGKFLKASAPDVRQVFMDSDVLLTRPNDYPSLNGGLQVASYPRFSARRKWARERLTPLPFSSEFEEGIYNAAAATLAAGDKLQDYRPLGKSAIDPPLWLTAISGGEDWPLAVLNDPPKDVSKRTLDQFLLKPPPAEPLPILSHEPPSRIWRNMFRLGFLLALAYSWFLWHAQSRKVVLSRDRLWSDLWLKPKEPGAFARAFYILCLTLSLAAVWLTIISSVIGYWRYSDNVSWLLLAGAAVPLALLVALAVWLTYQTISLDPPPSRIPVAQHWQYQLLALAPWLLFAAFGWALALILTPGQYFKSFFYSYRSIEIGSGVSPALPLLFVFLGFACWSVVQLQRRVFAEERYQLLPSLTGNQIAGSIDVLALRLEEYLEATFPEPFPYTSLASLLLFWAAWRITYRHFQSLEGSAYDAYYSAAVATLVTLLFLSTWRFWVCWRRLQLLLEQLAVHPIRWALQELPGKEYSWSPIWQSSPRKRSYVVLSRIVDCLRERRLLSANFTTPEDRLVEQHAQQLLQFVARREREGSALYKNLQTALQNTAQDVVDELNQGAWIQGSSETLMKEDEEDRKRTILRPGDAGSGADQKPVTLAKEFIALRFLSFIRYAMMQLRNLLTFIMIGFVLLAISLGCYPFSSPHLLAWTLVGCLVLTGAPVVLAFLEMERNAVLSWLTDTKAGRVEKGAFLLRVISFGILPLLSVLASHFPSIGQYVFSWVQPVVKSFH